MSARTNGLDYEERTVEFDAFFIEAKCPAWPNCANPHPEPWRRSTTCRSTDWEGAWQEFSAWTLRFPRGEYRLVRDRRTVERWVRYPG